MYQEVMVLSIFSVAMIPGILRVSFLLGQVVMFLSPLPLLPNHPVPPSLCPTEVHLLSLPPLQPGDLASRQQEVEGTLSPPRVPEQQQQGKHSGGRRSRSQMPPSSSAPSSSRWLLSLPRAFQVPYGFLLFALKLAPANTH